MVTTLHRPYSIVDVLVVLSLLVHMWATSNVEMVICNSCILCQGCKMYQIGTE